MKKIILSAVVFASLFSCSKDDNNNKGVEAPATYKFERHGESSVSFSGQTARLIMAGELGNVLKQKDGIVKTKAQLLEMYNDGTGFEDGTANASGKNIGGSVAYSLKSTEADNVKGMLKGFITKQADEVFPYWATDAAEGTAGVYVEKGGSSRYVNAKGLEYDQAFVKTLIGAMSYDQIANKYTTASKLDGDDTTNDAEVDGKHYTNMEHYWDEAFGYLYGLEEDLEAPVLGTDNLLNKYVGKEKDRVDVNGIYDAFKLGRAAIVAKDYGVRDEQAMFIQTELAKVIAIRAAHYLNGGAGFITDGEPRGEAFHDLSEAYGFIISLQFTADFTQTDVDAYLEKLDKDNGFWDVDAKTLTDMADDIVKKSGVTL